MKPDQLPDNPFIGLRPFESHESLLFFGRLKQTAELLQQLHQTRFLAVVGSSGCGKSSLIKAGLIPKLKAGFLVEDRDHWYITTMKPGDRPIHSLAQSLLNSFSDNPGQQEVENFADKIHDQGVIAILNMLGPELKNTDTNLLLLVDQFEEIFRFIMQSENQGDIEEAEDFVSIFLALVEQRELPIYGVMTMRSDFLGDCAVFHGLPETMNRSQYLVPRLSRQQRRQAIEGPVRLYQQSITARLVDQVLNDVGEDPDQLPVMQHALMRTYENWQKNPVGPIDIQHYQTIGTVHNALSIHADEALEGFSDDEKNITKQMFQTLTDTDPGNRRVRRPAYLNEIIGITGASREEIIKIINRFRTGGRSFLVLSPDSLKGNPLIDISHESLIRQWELLRDWVDEEAESRKIYLRLSEATELNKKDLGGLWRDPDLALTLAWIEKKRPNEVWAQRYVPNFKSVQKFLDKSKDQRDAEIAAKEAARKREQELKQTQALAAEQKKRADVERQRAEEQTRTAGRLRKRAIALAFVLLLAVIAAAIAMKQSFVAKKQEKIALEAKGEADAQKIIAEVQRDSAVAARKEADIQKKFALEAKNEAEKQKEQAILQRSIAQRQEKLAKTEALRADSLRTIADSSRAEAELLRRVSTSHLLATKSDIQEDSTLAVLLARSAYFLNKNNERGETDELYHALREALNKIDSGSSGGPVKLSKHRDWGNSVAYSPGGNFLISASADSTVILWNVKKNWKPTYLPKHQASVRSVAFSPDGDIFASGGDDYTIRLWNLKNPISQQGILNGHNDWVWSIIFSPDGKLLASGSADSTVRIWDLRQNPGNHKIFRGHRGSVRAVAFSSDNELLASASMDSTVRLWEINNGDGKPKRVLDHPSSVRAVAFSPESSLLATGTGGNTVRLWDLSDQQKETIYLRGHEGAVNSVAFSLDGKILASASADRTVRLWDLENPDKGAYITLEHDKWVWAVTFSPDRIHLATASSDKTIRIWVFRSDKLADIALEKVNRDLTVNEWQQAVGKTIPFEQDLLRPGRK